METCSTIHWGWNRLVWTQNFVLFSALNPSSIRRKKNRRNVAEFYMCAFDVSKTMASTHALCIWSPVFFPLHFETNVSTPITAYAVGDNAWSAKQIEEKGLRPMCRCLAFHCFPALSLSEINWNKVLFVWHRTSQVACSRIWDKSFLCHNLHNRTTCRCGWSVCPHVNEKFNIRRLLWKAAGTNTVSCGVVCHLERKTCSYKAWISTKCQKIWRRVPDHWDTGFSSGISNFWSILFALAQANLAKGKHAQILQHMVKWHFQISCSQIPRLRLTSLLPPRTSIADLSGLVCDAHDCPKKNGNDMESRKQKWLIFMKELFVQKKTLFHSNVTSPVLQKQNSLLKCHKCTGVEYATHWWGSAFHGSMYSSFCWLEWECGTVRQ